MSELLSRVEALTGPDRDVHQNALEAAWLAGGVALQEHAPELGLISRTVMVQVVCDAAIEAYILAVLRAKEGT